MQFPFVLVWFLVLAASLYVLLKSADYFTGIAEIFGKKLNIPSFIIGATVVAFGTSLPELAVSVTAILENNGDIVTGTVVGSNISNILLIAGVAILLSSGFVVDFRKHIVEFVFLIISTAAISFFLWDKQIGMAEGIILIVLLAGYLAYVVISPPAEEDEEKITKLQTRTYILFVLSLGGIWIGAKYTTRSIEEISQILGLGSSLIAQTVLALGTSLPELAVTIVSSRKKQYGIVLGNIIGSNIFNAFAVIGIPAVIGVATAHPFVVASDVFNQFAIPVMIVSTILILLLSFLKSTPRFFGVLFLALYAFFLLGSFMGVNLIKFF
jgi:cation:H+ antiporter